MDEKFNEKIEIRWDSIVLDIKNSINQIIKTVEIVAYVF